MPVSRAHARRRLLVALLTVLALGGGALAAASFGASYSFPDPVPVAECGPGAMPETSYQGRVPSSDYTSGRVARGYQCNTEEVSHHGATGGFKVHRYTDSQGNTCGYYDSTLLLPKEVLFNAVKGLGVVVLDMSDPARPRQTANLVTPAMLSPHESLLLNDERGLLVAVLGNPLTNVGLVEVYDVRTDCRSPQLLSSTPSAVLGHESGFAPDGRTFYAASTGGQTFVAIDITDPRAPRELFRQFGVNYHGLRLSDDGRTMYVANIGNPGSDLAVSSGGLRILDVSEIQDRRPDPLVRVLSDLSWREHSIPQAAEPFTRDGHDYLLETDEFANFGLAPLSVDFARSPVGGARIINVDDPTRPYVVSDLRLEVHQPDRRLGEQRRDPGAAIPVQGYAAHYCSVPTRDEPDLVACSMILSGLRLFDISDVENPREVGYFNRPTPAAGNPRNPIAIGAFAMSQPTYDAARDQVWYTDGNAGLYVVKLTNGLERLLDAPAGAPEPSGAAPGQPGQQPAPAGQPAGGLPDAVPTGPASVTEPGSDVPGRAGGRSADDVPVGADAGVGGGEPADEGPGRQDLLLVLLGLGLAAAVAAGARRRSH